MMRKHKNKVSSRTFFQNEGSQFLHEYIKVQMKALFFVNLIVFDLQAFPTEDYKLSFCKI